MPQPVPPDVPASSGEDGPLTLRAVKARALAEFGSLPGILGFGLGETSLNAYVADEPAAASLPLTYLGVPVVPQILGGDLVAQPAPRR